MFLGSPSCAFWRRVCPTVSLLLAASREDSGGVRSPAQKPTASKRGSSRPTPIWAQARESWSILEGQAGEEGIAPTPGGTAPPHPTCRLVPQRQPHDVTAQPVGEAVDPLVVEPVPRGLLQLPAGQRGSEGPFPASHHSLQMPMVLGTSQGEREKWAARNTGWSHIKGGKAQGGHKGDPRAGHGPVLDCPTKAAHLEQPGEATTDSCPVVEKTMLRAGLQKVATGHQVGATEQRKGTEQHTEAPCQSVPGYSRLLGADFAAPGAVGAVGSALPAHQVVAAPAGVGLGADAAQALLAAGAGPLAVALAAPLGPLAPDLQQLILQAPAQTRRVRAAGGPRDRHKALSQPHHSSPHPSSHPLGEPCLPRPIRT